MIDSNNGQVELSSQATFFLQSSHVRNVRSPLLKGVLRAFLLCLSMWMLPCEAKPPNVILLMADDLGWSDTGFNGNEVVKTPALDEMADHGLVFDRFYAAAPVCSPTRGSCLTGRHAYRYGIFTANVGHLLKEEWTLAEMLKSQGYQTGHFGKWHLGTLSKTGRDSNRGGDRNQQHFAPPTDHGFDTFFSTEAKTPTWDPLWAPPKHNRKWWDPVSAYKRTPYGTAYWTPKGKVKEPLDGDDSKVIMDQALKFIENNLESDQPFFTVIWFHAPHLPVVSGKHWTAPYDTLGGYHKHYYGCISALDHQVGRLRKALKDWELSTDTILWFCADNGPEGNSFQGPGSAWPLRGRKRSLHDGGVRVPAILEWQGTVSKGKRSSVPAVTSDFLPTIADLLGVDLPNRPYDGISLKRLIYPDKNQGGDDLMKREIGFQSARQVAWVRGNMKYYSPDQGKTDYLFDLNEDISESVNLAEKRPEKLAQLKSDLQAWRESTKLSASGADY